MILVWDSDLLSVFYSEVLHGLEHFGFNYPSVSFLVSTFPCFDSFSDFATSSDLCLVAATQSCCYGVNIKYPPPLLTGQRPLPQLVVLLRGDWLMNALTLLMD